MTLGLSIKTAASNAGAAAASSARAVARGRRLAGYTTELLNVLNVLGGLIDLEPAQAALLERICAETLIDDATLRQAGVFAVTEAPKRKAVQASHGPDLLTDVPSLGG